MPRLLELLPANEAERLAALRRYDILDTPPDGAFERLTAMAVRIFRVPISLITIVDYDRIWFKSQVGVNVSQIERDPGLCASAILQDDVWLVEEARTDPRTLSNPLVAGEFGLQFYAGAPLSTADGFNLGMFCIIDKQPRQLTASENLTLQDLAQIVIDELELRLAARQTIHLERIARQQAQEALTQAEHLANTDQLTGLGNRRAFDHQMQQQIKWSDQHQKDVVIGIIDLNGLKIINDNYGHDRGDNLLRQFATALQSNLRHEDKAYRFGGDEFAVILPGATKADLPKLKQRLAQVIEPVKVLGFPEVGASIGLATLSETGKLPYKTVQLADTRMYQEKIAYYRMRQSSVAQ